LQAAKVDQQRLRAKDVFLKHLPVVMPMEAGTISAAGK